MSNILFSGGVDYLVIFLVYIQWYALRRLVLTLDYISKLTFYFFIQFRSISVNVASACTPTNANATKIWNVSRITRCFCKIAECRSVESVPSNRNWDDHYEKWTVSFFFFELLNKQCRTGHRNVVLSELVVNIIIHSKSALQIQIFSTNDPYLTLS